jgi:hypothetical protein
MSAALEEPVPRIRIHPDRIVCWGIQDTSDDTRRKT